METPSLWKLVFLPVCGILLDVTGFLSELPTWSLSLSHKHLCSPAPLFFSLSCCVDVQLWMNNTDHFLCSHSEDWRSDCIILICFLVNWIHHEFYPHLCFLVTLLVSLLCSWFTFLVQMTVLKYWSIFVKLRFTFSPLQSSPYFSKANCFFFFNTKSNRSVVIVFILRQSQQLFYKDTFLKFNITVSGFLASTLFSELQLHWVVFSDPGLPRSSPAQGLSIYSSLCQIVFLIEKRFIFISRTQLVDYFLREAFPDFPITWRQMQFSLKY